MSAFRDGWHFVKTMLKLYLIAAAVLVAVALIAAAIPGFQFTITLCVAFAAMLVLMYYLRKFPTPLTVGIFRTLCINIPIGFIQQRQKECGIFADPTEGLQLFFRCLQHSANGFIAFDQVMGDLICVAPGNRKIQQKLQNLVGLKVCQAFLLEAIAHPLAMSIMY